MAVILDESGSTLLDESGATILDESGGGGTPVVSTGAGIAVPGLARPGIAVPGLAGTPGTTPASTVTIYPGLSSTFMLPDTAGNLAWTQTRMNEELYGSGTGMYQARIKTVILSWSADPGQNTAYYPSPTIPNNTGQLVPELVTAAAQPTPAMGIWLGLGAYDGTSGGDYANFLYNCSNPSNGIVLGSFLTFQEKVASELYALYGTSLPVLDEGGSPILDEGGSPVLDESGPAAITGWYIPQLIDGGYPPGSTQANTAATYFQNLISYLHTTYPGLPVLVQPAYAGLQLTPAQFAATITQLWGGSVHPDIIAPQSGAGGAYTGGSDMTTAQIGSYFSAVSVALSGTGVALAESVDMYQGSGAPMTTANLAASMDAAAPYVSSYIGDSFTADMSPLSLGSATVYDNYLAALAYPPSVISATGVIAGVKSPATSTGFTGAINGTGMIAGTRHSSGSFAGPAAGTGMVSVASGAVGKISGTGTVSGSRLPVVVNQWAGTFVQPAAFQNMPPALQSTVIALDPAASAGGGTGVPAAGNWLVCIAGWNQEGIPASTRASADDIHSFWRPGDVTESNWAVSPATGNTRVSVWYTANLARVPGDVYVAPDGAMAGMAALVIELSGTGPWDVVTGIAVNYAGKATTMPLALPAPSAASFAIAAVCGDSDAASQAFAPAGWETLSTVTATNGVNHTCDAVLTSAILLSTSSPVSVTATSGSATDLAGVIISFESYAPSPVQADQNPNWPGIRFEAAFGGGFQTPPDQLTWYDLSDRLWSWDETTGTQYQLGEIQATNLDLELDNWDNALASDNPGSPYYAPGALNENMSFQSGISPWTATGSAAIAWSAAQAYASSPGAVAAYSLEVTPNGTTADPGAVSEKDAVSGGTVYSASAWFYSAAGYSSGAQVAISWYTSGGTLISAVTSAAVVISAATWTQVTELNQTSPPNAAYATITVQFSGTPGANPFFVAEAAITAGATAVATGCVTTGVPVRIRAAIGTIGGVTEDRWYVIQRNAEQWPQQVDRAYRRFAAVTATDIWSAMSATGPTPFLGEVLQDSPHSLWPCNDQPLEGGVLPTSLLNAAPGNTLPLNVVLSPDGVTLQYWYDAAGQSQPGSVAPSLATYTDAADPGWNYGDPLASQTSYDTTNPVTASPGSSAWQVTGQAGDTGSYGWFLSANDPGFPALSSGITVAGWFSIPFWATGNIGFASGGKPVYAPQLEQPYSPLTLLELATGSEPVAELQLTQAGGHLNLITYTGATATTTGIYAASDLRCGSWVHVAAVLTTTTWTIYVNGGITAAVSGSAAGMTSAWSWLIANGDLGANGGSPGGTGLVHGGNMSASDLGVWPAPLPPWRIRAHYNAAATGFGLIPAPQSITAAFQEGQGGTDPYTPDGSTNSGAGYDKAPGLVASAIVTSNIGGYTSGPSARAVASDFSLYAPGEPLPTDNLWVSWVSSAPLNTVYLGAAIGTEQSASTDLGSGDAYHSGYGASATGVGVCHVGAGTGAAPPVNPTPLGDTVQQRIERCLGYAKVTYPGRCIDPASLLVQAATDIGGQQAAQNVQNIVQSDSGLLFIDNCGNTTYWMRSHLASQYSSPVWEIGPAQSPYYREINWIADPQRVWNLIVITPFSPDSATLPLISPSQVALVEASTEQFGSQPLPITSYLQSQQEMHNQADWLLANYGTLHVRAENVKLDAAPDPSLWPMILGINVGDVSTAQMWQIGAGGATWTFRVSRIKRHVEFNGDTGRTEASVTLNLDWEPPEYWT